MSEGYVAPGFERVREAFDAGLADEMGAGFAAIRDGDPVRARQMMATHLEGSRDRLFEGYQQPDDLSPELPQPVAQA